MNWKPTLKLATCAAALGLLALPAVSLAHLEVQNKGGVAFVSGGIGKEERQAIQQMARQFNLKATFAVKSGQFLGDVPVRIIDAGGATVLETIANGPILFAQLPPGKYTVVANMDGSERKASAQVASNHQSQVLLTWPAGTNSD